MESQTPAETLPDFAVIGPIAVPDAEIAPRMPVQPGSVSASQPMLLSHEDLTRITDAHDEADWVVEKLIDKESLVLVAGDSGLGKSPLLYQLGIAVAAGVPFLGFPTKQGSVAYLDLENGARPSKELAERVSNHLGLEKVPDNFSVNLPGYSLEAEVETIIKNYRPSLIIIDSLRDYDPEADSKNNLAASLLNRLRPIARQYGTAILFVHHVRKPGPEGTRSLEDMPPNLWFNEVSGARALTNHTDTRIGIDRPRERGNAGDDSHEEVALVIKGFTRIDGEFGPIYVARRFGDDGKPTGYRRMVGADLLFNDERKKAFASLPDNFSFGEAKRALGRADQSTINFLSKCDSLGLIEKVGRGKYRKLLPTSPHDSHGEDGVRKIQ